VTSVLLDSRINFFIVFNYFLLIAKFIPMI